MNTLKKRMLRVGAVALLSFVMLVPAACDSASGGSGDSDVSNGNSDLWRARLKDFQTKEKKAGGECYLLYNIYDTDPAKAGKRVPQADMPIDSATGDPQTTPIVSGPDGELELALPPGTKWGFECDLGEGDSFRPTFQYNIVSDTRDYDNEDIWVISNGMYTLAPIPAGINLDEGLGVVAGRLVWHTADGVEEYVGCGELSLEVPGDEDVSDLVRYFGDNDMPVPTDGDGARINTNPNNGLFLGANLPLGDVTMTMKIGDTVVGAERIFCEPGSVVISNIEVGEALGGMTADTFDANPTAGDCR